MSTRLIDTERWIASSFYRSHALLGLLPLGFFLMNSLTGSLSSVQQILMQVGPILSGVLFIIAGIFYAVGQLMTPEKKASFHTTSINIIIGAVIVAILSVTSNTFALASTHLLSNLTMSNATT